MVAKAEKAAGTVPAAGTAGLVGLAVRAAAAMATLERT